MKLFVLLAACAAVLCAQGPAQLPVNMDLPADTVVARTPDGKPITAGEIRAILLSGDPKSLAMARNSPEVFLGSVFMNRYLAGEAEKAHLAEQSPMKEQLAYIFEAFLANAVVQQLRESYIVPEQAINDYYTTNSSRFDFARIKVLAIGFCPVPTVTGTTTEEIAKAAQDAVAAADCKHKRTEEQARDISVGLVGTIRGGKDFVKMVKQYSEDPDSKATDGDFGLVTRTNSFKQEIKDAVFALKVGDISDPVRSGNFFYIITIKEKTVQPLATVRESIIQELKQKHFTDSMYDLQKQLKPVIERPDFFTAAKPQ
jgi:peptidyl-prolyl cis-trans isomerase C